MTTLGCSCITSIVGRSGRMHAAGYRAFRRWGPKNGFWCWKRQTCLSGWREPFSDRFFLLSHRSSWSSAVSTSRQESLDGETDQTTIAFKKKWHPVESTLFNDGAESVHKEIPRPSDKVRGSMHSLEDEKLELGFPSESGVAGLEGSRKEVRGSFPHRNWGLQSLERTAEHEGIVSQQELPLPDKAEISDDVSPIRLTNAAVQKLRLINSRRRAKGSKPCCLRLHVEGGGCAGFHYEFRLEDASETRQDEGTDMIFHYGDTWLLVNKAFEGIFDDCVIDYEEELIGSQFVIRQNKAATASCNCGHSFEIPGLSF